MDSKNRLEEIFSHFPGIGPRQAKRFVYYLLSKPSSFIKEFTELIDDVKKATAECELCHRIFMHKKNGDKICAICRDVNRDKSLLMIVARDSDFESIEKSGAYKGFYFILGGTVPILDKDPEKRIRLKSLLEKIAVLEDAENRKLPHDKSVPEKSPSAKSLTEIILSLNTTPDGEHTAEIVKDAILKVTKNPSLRISLLGRGLSTGAELEYVDSDTIKNALRNRH